MAIIKFDNGTSVNFNGNPTPQDIDEVEKHLTSQGGMQQSHKPSFLEDEASAISQIGQDRADFRSGKVGLPESLLRVAGGVGRVGFLNPVSHLTSNAYNMVANSSLNPQISAENHLIPTESEVAQSASNLGIPQAMNSFKENHPRLSRDIGSAVDVGATTLGVTGLVRGVQSLREHPPIENTLMETGASGESTAPSYAQTIKHHFGVDDLSDPRQVAIGNNNAQRVIDSLTEKAQGYIPDTVTGEMPDAYNAIQSKIKFLEGARQSMVSAARVPDAPPGLISNLSHVGHQIYNVGSRAARDAAILYGGYRILGGPPMTGTI